MATAIPAGAATALATDPAVKSRDPRDYVEPRVWDRLVTLLMRDHPYTRNYSTMLLEQAVAYLVTAFETWGEEREICCGPIVDSAVHVFILDTRNYREFCARHFAGKFLEHIPEVAFKYDGSVEKTAKLLAERGWAVEWDAWEADYAKCGPCHPGASCH